MKAPASEAPPVIEYEPDPEPIHPYILEALRSARAGDLDALAWLESDCISWGLIEPNAAIMARLEISKPARKRPKRKAAQEAPGRTQRARTVSKHPARAALQAL